MNTRKNKNITKMFNRYIYIYISKFTFKKTNKYNVNNKKNVFNNLKQLVEQHLV